MRKLLIPLFAFVIVGMGSCADSSGGEEKEAEETTEAKPSMDKEEYDEALTVLIEEKKYDEAIDLLQEFHEFYPDEVSEEAVNELMNSLEMLKAKEEFKAEHGSWTVKTFVDDFGDPTGEKYMSNLEDIPGLFSNSAVDNEDLNVTMLFNQGKIFFLLYEYQDDLVKPGSYTDFKTKVKFKDGSDEVFDLDNYTDRLALDEKDSQKIIDEMLAGNTLKFLIQDIEYPTTKYMFLIDDFNGFEKSWNELNNN